MEEWVKEEIKKANNPLFQYSNIPMVFRFHYSTIPLFQLLLSEALIISRRERK